MRAVLTLVAVLAMLVAARAKPLECVLWPKSCQVPVVIPASPAPPVSQPAPMPVPPVAIPRPAPRPVAKPRPRIKSNFAKPKRKTVTAWCARVPAGTPLWMVQNAAARELGRPLTAGENQQARACLASKG